MRLRHWWACSPRGTLTRNYILTNHHSWAQAGHDRTQRPMATWAPSAGFPVSGGTKCPHRNWIKWKVSSGKSYLSMFLMGAVAPGPSCLEYWQEWQPDPNSALCFSTQVSTLLIEASDPNWIGHCCTHWFSSPLHFSWNCGENWVNNPLPPVVWASQLPLFA